MKVEFSLNSSTGPWTDYTDWVDLTGLKRNISLNAENDPQRSETGEIEAFGDGYDYFSTNIINSVNIYSNHVFVRLTDTLCSNEVYLFKVDSTNLRWCDNNECRVTFSMTGYNAVFDCIKATTLAHNTSGEFNQYPTSGNPHPRFRYCDVLKPTVFFGVMVTFFNSIDLLILSLNIVINSINFVITTLGFSPIGNIPFTYEKFIGCGRGWPAPFIRTYIANVCTACGVAVNNTTDPIHFDPTDPITPPQDNPYYNACLLTAPVTKGVVMTGAQDYIPTNQPSWTLFDLMSKMKNVWNARWYMKGNTLYFHRRDLMNDTIYGGAVSVDLSGADADNLLGHVCYTWNGDGKTKRLYAKYSPDVSDNIGNEMMKRFNGEYINTSGNPNYTEDREVILPDFGAASFVLDGQDTLYDANIVNAVGSVLSGFPFEYCLKTQGDTLALNKILIYDDNTPINDARALRVNRSIYLGCPEFIDDQGGFFPISASETRHINYPMSFSPCQNGVIPANLWRYWEIETPTSGKLTGMAFEFRLQYCCQYNTLDLFMKVLMPDGVRKGEILSIDYDYLTREILLKGNLL